MLWRIVFCVWYLFQNHCRRVSNSTDCNSGLNHSVVELLPHFAKPRDMVLYILIISYTYILIVQSISFSIIPIIAIIRKQCILFRWSLMIDLSIIKLFNCKNNPYQQIFNTLIRFIHHPYLYIPSHINLFPYNTISSDTPKGK